MNGRARTFILAAVTVAVLETPMAWAQGALLPTPEPIVSAENTPWYLGGEPITFAGNIYYLAGPQVFFNRFEMIRSGFYEGIALYTRTTIEPFSVVFVPVGGGLMQPYERRRAGDVAGTTGSMTPAFPVVTAAEQATGLLLQAAGPPPRVAMSIGDTSRELTDVTPGSRPGYVVPNPAASSGRDVDIPAIAMTVGPITTALRPKGINAVFIDYDKRRWFSSGPAVEFSPTRFARVADYYGFPVYKEQGKEGTIYVTLTGSQTGLVTPYSVRP